ELDLYEMLDEKKLSIDEKDARVDEVIGLTHLEDLLAQHPYDLSGGEQQHLALAKILLMKPKILILDEPTKGLDNHYKLELGQILKNLQEKQGVTIMVSHDVEFCARFADRCGLFFDGNLVTTGRPREFFAGNSFYTTSANRMSRHLFDNAVTAEDVIELCKENTGAGGPMDKTRAQGLIVPMESKGGDGTLQPEAPQRKRLRDNRPSPLKITLIWLAIIAACAGATWMCFAYLGSSKYYSSVLMCFIFVFIGIQYLRPHVDAGPPVVAPKDHRIGKRTWLCAMMILVAIPLTIWAGMKFGGDRKYYLISMAIIVYTIISFLVSFEGRKPQARELVVIATMAAIAVAMRAAFFMLPQFKPVIALVIIAGVCFGGESGFLVGAVTGFVSNFFFGQGPWTPWQMFAFGIIGFLAAILFKKGWLGTSKLPMCIFGGAVAMLIYGPIMDVASVLMWSSSLNWPTVLSFLATGLPFNLVHAIATIFFLSIFSQPMIEKLERIKLKYGLMES
ncbi:ATP-binding cassette domain-containing protein, partial [Eubacterium aggregans]|uniref:ATP-binding cassette domain-containing protein n=1 Tax=Eubacterium aggregans TaxID=81409 RepID=UPI003F2FE004